MMMPSRIASTEKAKKRATIRNSRSWSWTLFCFGSGILATLTWARSLECSPSIIVGKVAAFACIVCPASLHFAPPLLAGPDQYTGLPDASLICDFQVLLIWLVTELGS